MTKTVGKCSMIVLVVGLCGAVAAAQDCVDWIDRSQTPPNGIELVFDSARGVTVRPGAGIWEWNGTTWVWKGLFGPGGMLIAHAAAYDAERGETLMHGGSTDRGLSGITNQTWAYDGSDWQLVSLDGPALWSHAMTFDSTRDVVVLFGGRDPDGNHSGETWEWNGQAWTRVSTTGPRPGASHKMAHDSVRGVTVLYDRNDQGVGETWEWDGQDWALVDAASPFPSSPILLTYDSARAVTLLQHLDEHETWTWDGAQWTLVAQGDLIPHSSAGLAFDSARGVGVLVTPFSTWEWNGVNWEDHRLALPQEEYRSMAFDSDRGVTVLYFLYGLGAQETWEWDGRELVLRATEGPPTGAGRPPMVYDGARRETFLFDGNDTWTWDGVAWTMKQVSNPPSRHEAGIAYHEQTEQVIMHGGFSAGGNDTWVWNGSTWTLVDESGPSRNRHAMAYDSDRGVVLMFGGVGNGDWQNDTWEWNGQTWTQISDVGPLVFGHAMAYDASAGLMRVFGGYVKDGGWDDLWSWDGQDWTLGQFEGEIPPGDRYPRMVYDSSRAVMVVRSGNPGRLWELGCPCPADIDGDGDLDAKDFFGYLDLFASGDGRADIDGDGDIDAEDFFGYLDLFVQGCG